MKKKILSAVATLLLVVAYFAFKHFFQKIDPPVIEMDGVKIELKTTTVKELLDKGFEIKDPQTFEPVKSVPGRKYNTICGSFIKDKKSYASFGVVNKSYTEEKIEKCNIMELTFFYSYPTSYQDATINGFNPKGLTLNQVKEKLGEPHHGDSKYIVYRTKDDSCDTTYEFGDNGILSKVQIEVNKIALK